MPESSAVAEASLWCSPEALPGSTRLAGTSAGSVPGSGGGEIVSASLSETLGYEVPLLAQLPLDIRLREGSDTGLPATVAQDGKPAADAPAALELSAVAQRLTHRSRGLAGKSLGVTPA